MRIAFLNRGRETHHGGDLVMLDAIMAALRRKGVECIGTGWDWERIRSGAFSLCHVIHSNFDWSWGNYVATKRAAKPYVLTPLYYPGLLAGITQEQLREMVSGAQLVLPFSHREAQELRESIGYFPYEAIPCGTDPMFHNTTPASEREGVLCIAARGPEDKGIPIVREACEIAEMSLTCVSGSRLEYGELPAIYAKHHIFVNASDSERMSLTVGEALASGCFVLDSHGNRGSSWYGEKHLILTQEQIEPKALASILKHLRFTEGPQEPGEQARRLTWDYVAERLLEVYRWVCS